MVAPRIRLGSAKDITSFFIYLTLQSYDVMLIPPNFWDILHGNVTNVTFSSYLCDLYETRTYRNDNDENHQHHVYGGGAGRVQALWIGGVAVAGLRTSGCLLGDRFLDLYDDGHHPEVCRQDAKVI